MANKQAKFNLSSILGQIRVPLTLGEKVDFESTLNSVIGGAVEKIEKSRGPQYSMDEVKAGNVPYLNLLVKDIELGLLGMPIYSKNGNNSVDFFKSSFEAFTRYRVIKDTGWNLYSNLPDEDYHKIIKKACDKIISKYEHTIDDQLRFNMPHIVEQVIKEIGSSDYKKWLWSTSLIFQDGV